jgi:golgi to ER traffic protein 4
MGNVRAASQSLLLFTAKLGSSAQSPTLGVQEVSSKTSDLRVYPSLPLLNFLGLLLLAVQRGAPDLFRQLKGHYAQQLKDAAAGTWDESLAQIGEMYFNIKIPSQTNPLFDMMGSLLMGGSGGTPRSRTPRTVGAQAPPPPQLG